MSRPINVTCTTTRLNVATKLEASTHKTAETVFVTRDLGL